MNTEKILENQETLNAFIQTCLEKQAFELLQAELRGKKRKFFIFRCYSRFNRLRAARERKELEKKLG